MKWPLHLPSQCLVCRAWPCTDVLCAPCMQGFHEPAQRCIGCALALAGLSPQRPCCGTCLKAPPLWRTAHAWVDYSFPWSQLITRWKFGQEAAWAQHFSRWMLLTPAISHVLQSCDLVIPIPLSAERMRERGYNPAAQIARKLSPSRYRPQLLQRLRHTPAQSGLSREQRLRNLRHAFEVPATHRPAVAGKKIVLVDDVMTTGATFTMASLCLLQAGAAHVDVLSVARTPSSSG